MVGSDGEGMTKSRCPMSVAELVETNLPALPDEEFGPHASRPWLAIDLDSAGNLDPAAVEPRLATLPCPIVGVASTPVEERWVSLCDVVVGDRADLEPIAATIAAAPLAAMTFVQLMRLIERMSPEQALVAESLAYGVLQAGPEFRAWLAARPEGAAAGNNEGPAVLVERDGSRLALTLNRPASRNAMSVEMRDALSEALDLASADPAISGVELSAVGRCYSVGGDLSEFGEAADAATAHWVRSIRSPARSALRCAEKLHVRVHGACIGSGIEVAAFAQHVAAAPNSFFQLPELRLGLIPGSGGCVSVARRIGRHRTAYLVLTGRRIGARTALEWGLVDSIG